MKPEAVETADRERAKRVVYAVVYGVGKNVTKSDTWTYQISYIQPVTCLCNTRSLTACYVSMGKALTIGHTTNLVHIYPIYLNWLYTYTNWLVTYTIYLNWLYHY